MALTYKKIADVTVGSGGTEYIDFTSIPQTYDDLVLHCSIRGSATNQYELINLILNNDTSNSYTMRRISGVGSGNIDNGTNTLTSGINIGYSADSAAGANHFSSTIVYIPNYTSTSVHKVVYSDYAWEQNATLSFVGFAGGKNTPTTEITSIRLNGEYGSWLQHSSATLYGIKNS